MLLEAWVTSACCWCLVACSRRLGSLLLVTGVLLQAPSELGHLHLLLVSCCKLPANWVTSACCWGLVASSWRLGSPPLIAGVLLQAPRELGHLRLLLVSCCKLPVNWVTSCWCLVASFQRTGSPLLVAGVLLQVPGGMGHLCLLLVSCCKLPVNWITPARTHPPDPFVLPLQKLLTAPRAGLKTAGAGSFQYWAPVVWNLLLLNIHLSLSLSSLKAQLETHLFLTAFPYLPVCVSALRNVNCVL